MLAAAVRAHKHATRPGLYRPQAGHAPARHAPRRPAAPLSQGCRQHCRMTWFCHCDAAWRSAQGHSRVKEAGGACWAATAGMFRGWIVVTTLTGWQATSSSSSSSQVSPGSLWAVCQPSGGTQMAGSPRSASAWMPTGTLQPQSAQGLSWGAAWLLPAAGSAVLYGPALRLQPCRPGSGHGVALQQTPCRVTAAGTM